MTSRLMHSPEQSSLPASGQAEVPFASTFGVTAPVPAGPSARPLKLVIQIPCLNEETTLPQTLADLPRAIPGIATIETLVIDDGSADRTSDVARALGVTRVVRFTARRGLAQAFARGLWEALDMGADIVVNTDADNQYRGDDVARLVAPILAGQADMVIGDRQVDQVAAFSPLKKALQKLGSWVVGKLANVHVPDTTSGFRAYARNAALRLKVVSDFTYTVETVIQATHKNIVIASVPVRTNPVTRPSRLFHSTVHYIQRSIATMLRMYVVYRPLRFFLSLSAVFLVASAALFLRFLAIYLSAGRGVQTGHVQSLIVAGVLAMVGVLLMALGVISDLIATNRRVLEEILVSARTLRLEESTRRKQP
ncbi:MAG TPA: glycosyltransferase family 2 protein [Candidatus Eisenbacteria bacterium]|nr:glycosyltransferase family 2 protein [Candidatus Eisenbacteria bacterium]